MEVKMSAALGAIKQNNYTQDSYEKNLPQKAGGAGALQMVCGVGAIAITIALFVIATMGATGQLNGIIVGGCAVGLGGALLIANIISTILSWGQGASTCISNAIGVITMLAIVIIGALGIAGVLPATTVGLTVAIITGVNLAMLCCGVCCLSAVICAASTSSSSYSS